MKSPGWSRKTLGVKKTPAAGSPRRAVRRNQGLPEVGRAKPPAAGCGQYGGGRVGLARGALEGWAQASGTTLQPAWSFGEGRCQRFGRKAPLGQGQRSPYFVWRDPNCSQLLL